jgi:abhydrolase domain-containing protein 12
LSQNAGSVAQGWRPDIYRALSDGSTSDIHILAPDYRGFGYSSGFPTEEGLIVDGIATVNWALKIAKIPPSRIVVIGHSLGTAVTSAVVEAFAKNGTEFAGVILNSGFTDLPTLLQSYAIGGWVPVLAPLKHLPALQKRFAGCLVDTWPSTTRLANFVRISKRLRLFIIHAKDDHEIPYEQSDSLFLAAANATTSAGMELSLLNKMKARGTVDMGDGSFVSTWKADGNKIIRQQVVNYGGHNRVMTFAPVALAVLKAFELDNDRVLPEE